jgi:hypothetical protein
MSGAPDVMNRTILLALIAAWVAIFILKRVGRLMARKAGRAALAEVGKRALARVPPKVSLHKNEWPKWMHQSAVEQQAGLLRKEGFTDLGAYTASTIPGVMIRMMAQPQTYVAAHIYDSPRLGSWTEFVTRYTDGSSHSLSTLSPTGMDHPDWVRKIQADQKTPNDQLYRQFLTQREWHGIKSVAPEETIREFEENYAKWAAWRQQRGFAPKEVAQVAVNWLHKIPGTGKNQ